MRLEGRNAEARIVANDNLRAALTVTHSGSFSRAEVFHLSAASATPQRAGDLTLDRTRCPRCA